MDSMEDYVHEDYGYNEMNSTSRSRYAVAIDLRLTIEINAESEEDAEEILLKAFHECNAYDPLDNISFAINRHPHAAARIKAAVAAPDADQTVNSWEV